MVLLPGAASARLMRGIAGLAILPLALSSLLLGCRPHTRQPVIVWLHGPYVDDGIVRLIRSRASAPPPGVRIVLQQVPTDLDDVVQQAREVARGDSIAAVALTGFSRQLLVAARVFNQAGIPHVLPVSTSRLFDETGPWTFSIPPNDSIEGCFMAAFAAERLRDRSIVLLYDDNEYGLGIRGGVLAELPAHGITLVREVPFDPENDLGVLLDAALLQGHADAVLFGGYSGEAGAVAAHVATIPDLALVASDGSLADPAVFVDGALARSGRQFAATLWAPDTTRAETRDFLKTFQAEAGRPAGMLDGLVYDATQLLVTAIRTVGPDRAAIRDYLRSLGSRRPRYEGASGPIGFGASRDPALAIGRVGRDGRLQTPLRYGALSCAR